MSRNPLRDAIASVAFGPLEQRQSIPPFFPSYDVIGKIGNDSTLQLRTWLVDENGNRRGAPRWFEIKVTEKI